MDSMITAAARALATGDPLGALKRVALRDDPPALALRGIAMAQLADSARAKRLWRNAARGFGPKEPVARARCVVAEAGIAFASRDLGWPVKALHAARATLQEHGDHANAAHAGYLSSYSRDPWKKNMRRYWRSCPMASRGPARRSHWRSAPVNAPCSARSTRSRKPARCNLSVEAVLAAG